MKILVLATKPPWPAVDGGRLLLRTTLEGLAARGHQLTLVAPYAPGLASAAAIEAASSDLCVTHLVPITSRLRLASLARSLVRRRPFSIDRHGHAAVRRKVAALLAEESWDVVHAEQLQAVSHTRPARARGIPVVLRAQNVESDLWSAAARLRPWSPVGEWEAGRLARWEGRAVARAAATVAITEADAERLSQLALSYLGGRLGHVAVVRAPFVSCLPAAERRLDGDPALVLFGSAGWSPNRDSVRFFGEAIWPEVRAALPAARLHVIGDWHDCLEGDSVVRLPASVDSREAFAPGSILVLPLRFASGVRMRILEAWARGISVVATPQAAAGLEAEDGRELLLASDAAEFTAAIHRLVEEPALGRRLTAAGRTLLASRHSPQAAADQLEAIYRRVSWRAET